MKNDSIHPNERVNPQDHLYNFWRSYIEKIEAFLREYW